MKAVWLVLLSALTVVAAAADPVLVKLTPRVVEADQSVSWEQPLSQMTEPGTPVVVNIDAEGLSIRVSVTPFARGGDYLLVVQGTVRQKRASGVKGSTSVQSLLVPSGEPIAYFPLGRSEEEEGRQMVVIIQVGASVE